MPLLQIVVPPPQLVWQLPLEQTVPEGQTVPQTPQLTLSVARELQTPLQSCSPLLQVIAQWPRLHSSPAGQTAPQAPQFAGSFSRFAQTAVGPVPHTV